MSRREKIIAVILSGVVIVWAWIYLPKLGKRPRLEPRVKSDPVRPSLDHQETKPGKVFSLEDALGRIELKLKNEAPVLKNDPFRIFPFKVDLTSHPVEFSDLILSGVLWEKEAPVALINGEMVKVGETFAGFTVDVIRPDEVVVKKGEERYTLRLWTKKGGQ